MKRSIAIALAALAATVLLCPQVRAAETQDIAPLLIESCVYGQPLDVSPYDLSEEALDEIVGRLHSDGSMPWYFTGGYNYRYNKDTGIVVEFTPENLDPQIYDRTRYEQALAQVMDRCILEGMSDVQIALAVHDYLILHNVYDETLQANTAYDLLINGTTVCAGYTDLYTDILNRAGVPCISVTSEAMAHAWNLVQIDGSWYHVDVTWDDPTPDRYGFVSHQYFLRTDAEIAAGEEKHYDWDSDIICSDTRFSDAYWLDIESAILFESRDVSYLLRSEDFTNYICRRDEATGKLTTLYTDSEPVVNIGRGNYTYTHRGLALRDGRLWFGTLDALRSIGTNGKNLKTEHRFQETGKYLYSFHLDGTTGYLTTADHDGNPSVSTLSLPATGEHLHSFTETDTPPQCEAAGYTTSVCSCGLECQSDPIAPTGHTFRETDGKAASIFSDGFSDQLCETCGHTQTTPLPRLTLVQWILQLLTRLGLISQETATAAS